MLYNPKWNVTADPLSLDGLIAWLETQPADKEYDFVSIKDCLVAQYLKFRGFKLYSCATRGFCHAEKWTRWLPFTSITHTDFPRVFNDVAVAYPHTFGDALIRAYAAAYHAAR